MLARYMAEEDDPEILQALKGVSVGGGGEEDERLSVEDRVLLGFQDRLKRAPRQVVRYARGGIPLWSIPAESNQWKVPACQCGAHRSFECQLLPSLLHVLEVDKYAEDTQNASAGIGYLLSNGMNWGSVAVYTCANSCSASSEELLVVQESVDGQAQSPRGQGEGAPIAVVEDMDDDEDFEPVM